MFSSILRKLFPKPRPVEQPRPVTLRFTDTRDWLADRARAITERLGPALNAHAARYAEARTTCLDALATLEQSKLKNTSLPHRALALMDGNRKEYARLVRNLLDAHAALPAEPEAFTAFFDPLVQALAQFFDKDSRRPYAVLQEFFAHESRAVDAAIRDLARTTHEAAKAIEQAGHPALAPAREAVEKLDAAVGSRQRIDAGLASARDRVQRLGRELTTLRVDIAALEQESDYQRARAQQEQCSERLQAHRAQLRERFSPLEPLLARLARLTSQHQALIEHYLDNPIEALLDDRDLRILDALVEGRHLLERGTIELKERRRDAALATLAALTPAALKDAVLEDERLRTEETALRERLAELPAVRKRAMRVDQLRRAELDHQDAVAHCESLGKQLAALGITAKRTAAEESLSRLAGAPVTLQV